MPAAWLASATPSRAADDAAPQPARLTAGEMPQDDSQLDSQFDSSLPTSQSDQASHPSHLKWRPYHSSAADTQAGDSANSDDEQTVYSDAAPIAPRVHLTRVIRDSSIVQTAATEAVQNPFNDDKTQPNPFPAPDATTPDTTQPPTLPPSTTTGPVTPGSQAPASQTPATTAPDSRARSPYTRPRTPARLSPAVAPDASSNTSLQPVSPPYVEPSPSDDLSCATHQHHCKQDEDALMKNTISKIGLDINEYGRQGDTVPCECSIGEGVVFAPRQWPLITYTWKASALCHKPLYFEEVQLERYGHSPGPIVEPLLSAAHFFITVPLLPYYMGVDPPLECQYTLGYYRPGDCAPYMLDPFPLSIRGAALEAGAVVGITAVIP